MTPKITDTAIISRANDLISSCHTMTLATAGDNMPWAAPVYYANVSHFFYFFSSPGSRHIQNALAAGHAACAIHAEERSWQNLRGLQMSGKIIAISNAGQSSKAIIAYVKKFPLVKTVFSSVKNLALNSFMSRFHASLYCFQPDYIVFMDNTVDFGFRREIPKDALT
ncbi:MAG: pyridoxamine 5'-phosphate oxidase family protein [Desulfobacteraceae bacterium]|nr:pyridoxamine 5'-phosphate oxidase family protein [Desulfobacteraceae bacterium]